ncbi:MAG: DUF938 domain-containing protein [Phycisphaerales bacterium]|nr:DUF938 domain-containing protein [Hyphomonadaceae bacterium]
MDARQQSPSTARNREPILAVLQLLLGERARVLEIASGTGEHAAFFAGAMPGWIWQPSDPDEAARASVAAWCADLGNVLAPAEIDARAAGWDVAGPFDAVIAINMIHISPWEATLGLMAGAGRLLRVGGLLVTYGAYKRGGAHTSPSNEQFEQWLKARDPAFGVRDVAEVEAAANVQGLRLREVIEMPANNLALVFER